MENNNLYVKNTADGFFSFNYDLKQTWHHSFNMQGVKPDYVYIKNFMDRRNEKNMSISIDLLKFILKFCFVTQKQLEMFLQLKGYSVENLDKLLDYFLQSRILNMFALSRFPLGEVPADAFRCYCLDFGGKHILSHYGTEDVLSWTSTNAARGAEFIAKYLTTAQFYLALMGSAEKDIVYFDSFESFNIGRRDMQVSGKFEIKQGFANRGFMLEIVRKYDLPSAFQKKSEKLDMLFSGKYIERYFSIPPVVLFLAENDQAAEEVGEIFCRNTKNDMFRITTDERIRNGFTEKSFMKYDPESKKLTTVKSSLFQPRKDKEKKGG